MSNQLQSPLPPPNTPEQKARLDFFSPDPAWHDDEFTTEEERQRYRDERTRLGSRPGGIGG